MKMSKSMGNTISPIDLMKEYGADILRLWALSVDFTEDHRIGKEILGTVADQYRKLRNTFRYLLGALDGFSEAERVPVDTMPELERYVLALLARMDGTLRQAVEDFDFNTYVRTLADFCNEDLSAFFFDIRKDCLYCDAADDPKRMAYRTVLDTLFHALVRYAAPVLVFTAEEVWGTRYPEGGSVHLLEWPVLPDTRADRRPVLDTGQGFSSGTAPEEGSQAPDQVRGDELLERWVRIRKYRTEINEAIEPLRREKVLGSSLEAEVSLPVDYEPVPTELEEVAIVAAIHPGAFDLEVTRPSHHKCGRCWRHLPEVSEDGALCGRCDTVVNG
jgi:isoleucyl-tRNA synthetase